MSFTADDLAEFVRRDASVDSCRFGDALAELAVDIDTDTDETVRDQRRNL
jgi:hypothetical protein